MYHGLFYFWQPTRERKFFTFLSKKKRKLMKVRKSWRKSWRRWWRRWKGKSRAMVFFFLVENSVHDGCC
jgi:hypothetical protein